MRFWVRRRCLPCWGYSSISNMIMRTKAMIAKDRMLRHRVEELKKEMRISQEQI